MAPVRFVIIVLPVLEEYRHDCGQCRPGHTCASCPKCHALCCHGRFAAKAASSAPHAHAAETESPKDSSKHEVSTWNDGIELCFHRL